jgi:small subunit ribosomal protein S15
MEKLKIIEANQSKPGDTGSPAVQIALLTERIKNLTAHLNANKQDKHSRRGLAQMVSERKKLLGYMESTDLEGYRELKKKLGIR